MPTDVQATHGEEENGSDLRSHEVSIQSGNSESANCACSANREVNNSHACSLSAKCEVGDPINNPTVRLNIPSDIGNNSHVGGDNKVQVVAGDEVNGRQNSSTTYAGRRRAEGRRSCEICSDKKAAVKRPKTGQMVSGVAHEVRSAVVVFVRHSWHGDLRGELQLPYYVCSALCWMFSIV